MKFSIKAHILQPLIPTYCLLCQLHAKNHELICEHCAETLPKTKNACLQCGLAILDMQTYCAACKTNPPAFDHTIALFQYESPISLLIAQLKFQQNLMIAALLSRYWIHYFLLHPTQLPELIIPVPLHYQRLKKRGFNQALEIAKPVGKYFGIPVDVSACVKVKNTEAQSSLSAKKRQNNIKNAFILTRTIKENHVAILDDVMTTGNTVSEISVLMKNSGAKSINILCFP